MNGYKMSLIRATGNSEYYGEFSTKEEAIETAEMFMEMSAEGYYVSYKVWYFEK